MQGADQHTRSTLGLSILPKHTSTCWPGELNRRPLNTFIFIICFAFWSPHLHLLQSFRRTSQLRLSVKLQKCFVDHETFHQRMCQQDSEWIFIFGWTHPLMCKKKKKKVHLVLFDGCWWRCSWTINLLPGKYNDVNSFPRNLCFLSHISCDKRNSVWIIAQKHDPRVQGPSVWLQCRPQTKPQTVYLHIIMWPSVSMTLPDSGRVLALSAHSVVVSCLLYSTAVGDHVEPLTGVLAMLCVLSSQMCTEHWGVTDHYPSGRWSLCVCVCVCVCVRACVCVRKKLVILLLTYFSPASSSLAVNSLATVTWAHYLTVAMLFYGMLCIPRALCCLWLPAVRLSHPIHCQTCIMFISSAFNGATWHCLFLQNRGFVQFEPSRMSHLYVSHPPYHHFYNILSYWFNRFNAVVRIWLDFRHILG